MKWLNFSLLILLVGCAGNYPGPDKQFAGSVVGAASGAATGAVTGYHVAAAAGPGAAVGAGFGMIAGGIQGYAQDQVEEDLIRVGQETAKQRQIAVAQEALTDHFKRRAELHPDRDIYPAEMFFYPDNDKLLPGANAIIGEIAKLNINRFPWSRMVVASYVKSKDRSEHAYNLASRRAKVFGNMLVQYGMEPRRIEGQAIIIDEPVLIDPQDLPWKYSQAIELIPADR